MKSFYFEENRIKAAIDKASADFDSNAGLIDELFNRSIRDSRLLSRSEKSTYERLQAANDSLLDQIDKLTKELKQVKADTRRKLRWDIDMADYPTYEEYSAALAEARYPTADEIDARIEQWSRGQFENHRNAGLTSDAGYCDPCSRENCPNQVPKVSRRIYCSDRCQRHQQYERWKQAQNKK